MTASSAMLRESPPAPEIPPLENGDVLSRGEFERRFHSMTWLKKAELVEGVVHLPSPVRDDLHGNPHAKLLGWLMAYEAETPGVSISDNATVRIDPDNVLQPDAVLMIEPSLGGQARFDSDGYIAGAPELVAEVSSTSASIDLNAKLLVYQRNQVREYVVWRTLDQAIDWFVLRDNTFERLVSGPEGVLRSRIFPGLWLDQSAMLRRDSAAVLTCLREVLASAEHAAFTPRVQS